MWNKETFSNVVIWSPEGQALGGMHFEIVEDGDNKYLTLPGINPNQKILKDVDPEKLLQIMIDFAKKAAQLVGADAVLIPQSASIHSNRDVISALINEDRFGKPVDLDHEHDFTEETYSYSWKKAYRIEV